MSSPKKRLSVWECGQNRAVGSPGKRIRDLRKSRKLTQPQVADATGIPQSTLSDLERGASAVPGGDTLTKLAAFFEVEAHWIVTGEGPKHTVSSRGDKETELLLYFRSLSHEGQAYLLSRAKAMHSDEHQAGGGKDSHAHATKPAPKRIQ